jgi:hypothetical protein
MSMNSTKSPSFVSIDFPSFASCCDTFSRLLWPSDSSKLVLPQIHHVTVFPPPEFLCSNILPLLVRLSQFCDPSQSSISLALAAELVVLASANSLETAHHRNFLFGPASALRIRSDKSCIQEMGALGNSNVRKRRLQDSMSVICEVLIALNLAPLQFGAQVCIEDVSKHSIVHDTILSIKTDSKNVLSQLPLEVYVEVVSSFRRQLQLALSGDPTPCPLFLFEENDSSSLESTQECEKVLIEGSLAASLLEQKFVQNEAFPSSSASTAYASTSKSHACNYRAVTASLLQGIVAQVASRFESSCVCVDNSHSYKRILEPVCSKVLQTIVFQASQKYHKYIQSSALAAFDADCDAGPFHDAASLVTCSDHVDVNKCISAQSGPIFGRHPSYRVPVPEVEVISFEQVNPVWTHQCKPGSRICVLLRCHQRLSGVVGNH